MYQPRHRGSCPLLRRKFLALLVLLATAVSPVQAQQPDPSVCNRTEQVRDAIVAALDFDVSDCADVIDIHLAGIGVLNLSRRSIETLQEGDFAGLTNLLHLQLSNNSLEALPTGAFFGLPALVFLDLGNNSLEALPAGAFSGLSALVFLDLSNNSLEALPAGVFSGLPSLRFLYLDGNPGSEGFRPIADAGADQTAGAAQVVILTATASGDDPWGDNVRYVWTRTDNSGSELTLMDAETASPSFVMPAGATGLEFELRVTGRGANGVVNHFVGTDSLKVRHPDAVVTLTGPEPAATTTEIVEDSISLVYTYTYSAADLHGRVLVLAGKLEVTAAVDGVAVTPTININEARGQGEITVVLRRQEYPNPDGHLLVVTLRLSATAEGFVLGEPSSMTTTFRFFSSVDSSVCARTEQVRDAIVASVPVSHCADVTDVHLAGISVLNLSGRSIETLQEGDFAGLTNLLQIQLSNNSLEALPAGVFSGLPALGLLYLSNNSLGALPAGAFSGLPALLLLDLRNNSLKALPAGVFSELPSLRFLYLDDNSLTALPAGVFSSLTDLNTLYLYNNPGSEGFRPIADAGADQTAVAAQVVILTATASGDDPWGDNVRYVWMRTDNSGSELTLMDAETASPSFVMPAGATGLEFELRVTGRGGDPFVGTDSLKVRHPDAVVTLTGPEPAAPTTEIVENEFSLVFTYSAADLHGRVPAGKIEVTAAVDGVAVTPTINIDEASGQGEITVVLRRQEYPGPIGHLLAVTLSLSASAAAEGFVLGEPSSITTPFSFFSSVAPSVCARTEQVRDAIVALVPVSHCADVTDVHLAGIVDMNLSWSSIVTLQEGDFAGLTNLSLLLLMNNSLEALPAGVFSEVPTLRFLHLTDNSLTALPAGAFSGLPALVLLALDDNSLTALPAGVFSGLPDLRRLFLDGNPGSESFRPIADAGADQTAGVGQVVTLTATASDDDPWGDNVRYVWTRTDNSGNDLTLMDAETASPSFVMPAGATGLEFELRVTGRGRGGGDPFVGTDSLKVRHLDTVATLTGAEPAATTNIGGDSIDLVYTYSAADLHGRILAGKIEVAAAVDGVAITPDINIDEARGQGEITVVLRRQEYPGPIGHLLAVTLSLSAAAEGFVLGEPSSMTTTFSFFSSVDPSVCARTEQVRDALVALVPVSHCADVTDVHLAAIYILDLSGRSIETLQEGDFADLTAMHYLDLDDNRLRTLPKDVFSEVPTLRLLHLHDNSLTALPGGVFSGLSALLLLNLSNNSLEALPAGLFSGFPTLGLLYLNNNPGSEGFRPIADAGADQTAGAGQVVTLTATASDDDPWGDNVRYVWTRTDNSGSELTLMDAETASPSFVMPAGATGLEFELRVTGRGGDNFIGTDRLKVRHPDAVVTLSGPEPATTTTEIVENEFSLVFTYSAADLHGRVPAGNIEVTAAVDGVAVTPDINIDEARGHGEITVVLRRQEYPGPIGHLLAVTLSLSAGAAAEGFVLGEPSSITTPFSFFSSVDPSVCARTEQVRDAIVASVPVSHCADVTDVDLAGIGALNLSWRSIVTLQEGDFAGLTNLSQLLLSNNRLAALPAGVFSGLPALLFLNLNDNSLEALPAGVFSGLPSLRFLYLDGNPGSEGFRPIADAGADQTAGAGQVVTLTATASGDDPWGDNVRYVWTRTDNSGSELTLMDAETASPSFVMPAGATGLEFELRVTGRGGDHFIGTDSLKVRHPDAVVTLTGPEPAATTTKIVEDSINLVYTYSAVDLHGRALTGSIEVTAAVDGVAVTPTININGARGEITIVLGREAYPHPEGHLLAVSLSATADGFVLGEPSSITTPFRFVVPAAPSVCARTKQVRNAIVALVPVSDCADVTNVHLDGIDVLNLSWRPIETLQEGDFAGLTNLLQLEQSNNSLEALPAGVFSGLPTLGFLYLSDNSLTALPAGAFSALPALRFLDLSYNSLEALPAGVFSELPTLRLLYLDDNSLTELSADIFSGLPSLQLLALQNNSLTALPGGVFSGLTALDFLLLDGNPGSEGFRPIADAGADQTAGTGQVVTLTATASDDDPWGDNVRYVWTRTDNSGSDLTLMDAETASPSFVMPADATGLEFELRVTGRGGDHFVGTDSLKVRHPDAVVTLTGPEPATTTTEIVENEFSLVFTYSTADLHGRVLAGKIEVTAAVDGVAVTPDINVDEARGQGEITVVLRRPEYPNPDGHLLAVTLSLSAGAVAEGFVLGEPSSITAPFSFDPFVCARTEQVRDAIVASVPVSHCADVTYVHLADIGALNLSRRSIVTLQEGDFAGLTNLFQLLLSNNRLAALPAGVFSGLPALLFLNLNDNSLEALPAGVFSGLSALRFLYLDGNPGSEGFRPIADAGADQTAVTAQVVTLTATASDADPWGDNVRYVWTRTDNSGSDLTLMDAETASPSFVMPAGATELEFELRVTGRGGDPFVGTDNLKVRHPDPNAVVVTLTGPEPAATTTNIVEDSINLVYTYSAADLHGRVLAGKIEVAAAVDGVGLTPTINIDEASGHGEITVVLRRPEYPNPIGHVLAVTLSLSAAAEGFVLGEPSSITTPFRFRAVDGP